MAQNDPDAARLAAELVEAKRVADEERRSNMAALRAEQADAQRAQGKREGLAEAHTAKQDEQIADIETTLRDFMAASLTWQTAINTRMDELATKLGEFLAGVDAVTKATLRAGERTFTRRQTFGIVSGFVLALLVAILLVISTIHGLQPTGK